MRASIIYIAYRGGVRLGVSVYIASVLNDKQPQRWQAVGADSTAGLYNTTQVAIKKTACKIRFGGVVRKAPVGM